MSEYQIIEHNDSNRRENERTPKNPHTVSYQYIRNQARPVEIKREARRVKRKAKG